MIKNKVICIIGGSGLIGKSFVNECKKQNARVIVADIFKDNKKLIKKNKENNIKYINIDITQESSIVSLFRYIKKEFLHLDSVVLCAYPKSKKFGSSFENLDPKYLKEDLFNQLGSPIILSKHAIKYFLKQGFGNIIHLSSIQGTTSPKFEHYKGTTMVSPIEYSAIKSGIISVTKYLAKFYRNKNIRVNCISPGGIKNNQPKKFLQRYKKECSSKGMLDPEDLNSALIFLLSDESRFINGQNIIVDDGWSL